MVGLLSSAAAPVLLVGGWTVAGDKRPSSFNPVTDTVSELTAAGAAGRWIMTAALLAVGACYIVTGISLRTTGPAGRLVLIAGAAAGMVVTANPLPAAGGDSLPHAIWASLGFTGLAAWPAGACRDGRSVPWALRPSVCLAIAGLHLLALAWFLAEIVTGAGLAGLAERAVGLEQALCPLTVVLSCRLSYAGLSRHAGGSGSRPQMA